MLIAVLLAAFFSGSETALVSASRIKMEIWLRRGLKGAQRTYHLLHYPEQFLSTTLVGTNIAIVVASTMLAIYLEPFFNGFTITLISSVVLLFFGEILPKSIARDQASIFSLRASFFLQIFYYALYPVIWIMKTLSLLLLRLFGFKPKGQKRIFSRKDMDLMVREGAKIGLVKKEHGGLISRFILRGNQKVKDIMIHRTEIVAVQRYSSIRTAIELFDKTGFSRLPVYGKHIDHILGLISTKDALLKKTGRVHQILRKILFVPESRKLVSLIRDMQESGIGIAIVVDEYGGTAGLVTVEDIIEEFFGDIQDEHDEDTVLYRKVGLKQIDVNARVSINDLNLRFRLQLPEGDYTTLGGLLMERLGHIPKRGEKVHLETCDVTVVSSSRKMAKWVRILKKAEVS